VPRFNRAATLAGSPKHQGPPKPKGGHTRAGKMKCKICGAEFANFMQTIFVDGNSTPLPVCGNMDCGTKYLDFQRSKRTKRQAAEKKRRETRYERLDKAFSIQELLHELEDDPEDTLS
jgi:ribosome-binding protein aMBF1 (putative translation factor)